jgi:hypothetical protein
VSIAGIVFEEKDVSKFPAYNQPLIPPPTPPETNFWFTLTTCTNKKKLKIKKYR